MRHSLESLMVLVRHISYQSRCLCELSFILKIGKNYNHVCTRCCSYLTSYTISNCAIFLKIINFNILCFEERRHFHNTEPVVLSQDTGNTSSWLSDSDRGLCQLYSSVWCCGSHRHGKVQFHFNKHSTAYSYNCFN